MLSTLFVSTLFLQPPTAAPIGAAGVVRLVDGATGADVPYNQVLEELRRRDVVVLGEEHDNTPGHKFYAELIVDLNRLRPDMAISMEQFERDVQGVVDDYLRDRIAEPEFLKHARPWPNYASDYRPQIEHAKQFKIDVIAGNLPRATAARCVSNERPQEPFLPSTSSTPYDKYYSLFQEQMKQHPGQMDGARMIGMYRAQCAKDDAMAESIVEYLASRPHRIPLVVHRCGNFHSDHGLGTVARILNRSPLLGVSVVSMVPAPDLAKPDLSKHLRKAHYLLLVPQMPKKPNPTAPKKTEPTAPREMVPPPQKSASVPK